MTGFCIRHMARPSPDPKTWLSQLIAHRRMRESQIVAALAGGA